MVLHSVSQQPYNPNLLWGVGRVGKVGIPAAAIAAAKGACERASIPTLSASQSPKRRCCHHTRVLACGGARKGDPWLVSGGTAGAGRCAPRPGR